MRNYSFVAVAFTLSLLTLAKVDAQSLSRKQEKALAKQVRSIEKQKSLEIDFECVKACVEHYERWSNQTVKMIFIDLDGEAREIEVARAYNWRVAELEYVNRAASYCGAAKRADRVAEYLTCIEHFEDRIQTTLPDTVPSFCQHGIDQPYYKDYYELLLELYASTKLYGGEARKFALQVAAAGKRDEFLKLFEEKRTELESFYTENKDDNGIVDLNVESMNQQSEFFRAILAELEILKETE